MNNYKFEHDWFSPNIPNLQKLFSGYQGQPKLNILEIGSLEGKSSVWFLDNVKDCVITCIDTWAGGKDHDPNNPEINFDRILSNFHHNMAFHQDRYRMMKMTSYEALIHLYLESKKFDFVFVDGSHTAKDVNCDLVLSWNLLNVGALIYCDDYFWGFNEADKPVFDSPKLGIDSFVNVYGDKIRPIIGMGNNAAIFVKTSE